jgi:glycine/D-amino acid oxidase-like deaminating enzyme
MKKIGIIGAGPVGLAAAETLTNAGIDVCVFDVGNQGRATYRAAAAFWTPFSSGVDDASASQQSKITLEHFQKLANSTTNRSSVSGVEERQLEMNFLKGTFGLRPEWSKIPSLGTIYANLGDPYLGRKLTPVLKQAGFPPNCQFRCEMTYRTPVVCVDIFIPWLKNQLSSNGVSFVPAEQALDFGSVESVNYWQQLINTAGVSTLVFCLGVETIAARFPLQSFRELNTFTPKKGIVAHVRHEPKAEDSIVLFEGGIFDTETLYLVPAVDRYILGGIVHTVGKPLCADDWVPSSKEKQGVLARAMAFLPEKYHHLIESELGTPENLKPNSEWRAGVRPVFAGGPLIGRFKETLFDREALYCFGHGGSGFTFCFDSAETLLEKYVN